MTTRIRKSVDTVVAPVEGGADVIDLAAAAPKAKRGKAAPSDEQTALLEAVVAAVADYDVSDSNVQAIKAAFESEMAGALAGHQQKSEALLERLLNALDGGVSQTAIAAQQDAARKAGGVFHPELLSGANVGYAADVARFAALPGDMPEGWVLLKDRTATALGFEQVSTLMRDVVDAARVKYEGKLPEGETVAAILDRAKVFRTKGSAIKPTLETSATKQAALDTLLALRANQTKAVEDAIKGVVEGSKSKKGKTALTFGEKVDALKAGLEELLKTIEAEGFTPGGHAHASYDALIKTVADGAIKVDALPADTVVAVEPDGSTSTPSA